MEFHKNKMSAILSNHEMASILNSITINGRNLMKIEFLLIRAGLLLILALPVTVAADVHRINRINLSENNNFSYYEEARITRYDFTRLVKLSDARVEAKNGYSSHFICGRILTRFIGGARTE